MPDDNLKIHTGFRISKSNLDFIENTGKNLGLTKTGVVDMFITILRNNPSDLAQLIQKAVKKSK
ncbi:MAG: hypothetical protein C0598_14650 [Marinilabiliales bacterium]|nr:MAG: hypothetical protein C0598_14650 [Marinilabiliales bacterium]